VTQPLNLKCDIDTLGFNMCLFKRVSLCNRYSLVRANKRKGVVGQEADDGTLDSLPGAEPYPPLAQLDAAGNEW
jgi:hypothetical protein